MTACLPMKYALGLQRVSFITTKTRDVCIDDV